MLAVQRLGDAIAKAWLRQGHDEALFGPIAVQMLQDSELLRATSPSSLHRWFCSGSSLPEQQFRDFGQPALTLYRDHKFYIELLAWLDSTTAVHQHSFAGAFGVLRGSSLHTRYDFECEEAASSELMFGKLTLRGVEVLRQGDVREIVPGSEFIHSLFHLERPSLTLVVRTQTIPRSLPQYSYTAPGLGYDPFFSPEPFATQLRLLESLRDRNDSDFWRLTSSALRRSDPWMALGLLKVALAAKEVRPELSRLVAIARGRHGRRADVILETLAAHAREQNIIARRREVHDPDHRFFLALLLNLHDRAAIYQAIADRHSGGDEETLVLRWVQELSAEGKLGLQFDALSLKMLHYALRDRPLQTFMDGLASVFGDEQVDTKADELETLWNELHDSLLLRPLLRPCGEFGGRG